MSQLLLVGNPARRKSRKHRSPAQKAATRRMIAANKSRKNPARRRARPAHAAATVKHHVRRVRRNPIRRHHRRVRRNPVSAHLMSIKGLVTNAAVGAVGAVGVDVAFGFVSSYLPASLSSEKDAAGATNYGYYLAKGAAAVALGLGLKRVIGASKAAAVVEGSLTVTLYRAIAGFMASSLPSVKLGAYVSSPFQSNMSPAPQVTNVRQNPLRLAGAPSRMGAYVSGGHVSMREREGLVR